MEAAVAQKMNIGDCIQKVQKDVLSKCNERYAGKRYKGFIKFEYESNVINITVFKPSSYKLKRLLAGRWVAQKALR